MGFSAFTKALERSKFYKESRLTLITRPNGETEFYCTLYISPGRGKRKCPVEVAGVAARSGAIFADIQVGKETLPEDARVVVHRVRNLLTQLSTATIKQMEEGGDARTHRKG